MVLVRLSCWRGQVFLVVVRLPNRGEGEKESMEHACQMEIFLPFFLLIAFISFTLNE